MTPPAPQQRRRRAVTRGDRETFLARLRDGWSVKAAAEATGHGRQRFYELRAEDKRFAEDFAQAVEEGTDRLEQVALEIATDGVVEEVRDGVGALVSTRRRRDPQMVRFLLAARRPAIYSERGHVEVTGVREQTQAEIQEALERFTASVAQAAAEQGLDGSTRQPIDPPPPRALPPAPD